MDFLYIGRVGLLLRECYVYHYVLHTIPHAMVQHSIRTATLAGCYQHLSRHVRPWRGILKWHSLWNIESQGSETDMNVFYPILFRDMHM